MKEVRNQMTMNYYAIEGTDTSGKSTQCDRVGALFDAHDIEAIIPSHSSQPPVGGKFKPLPADKQCHARVVMVKEPGSYCLGKTVRELTLDPRTDERTRFLLFLAQRSSLMDKMKYLNSIEPKCTVIADRSLISGIAYSKLDYELALRMNLFATGGVVPKKVVILEMNKHELNNRLGSKTPDYIERQGVDRLMSIQSRIIEVCDTLKSKCNTEYIRIDAAQDPSSITEQILEYFEMEIRAG